MQTQLFDLAPFTQELLCENCVSASQGWDADISGPYQVRPATQRVTTDLGNWLLCDDCAPLLAGI